MTKIKVVILQEYIPAYRVPFFDRLVELATANDIEVVVAAGRPNKVQAQRGDTATPPYLLPIAQREFSIGGKRLVFRNVFRAVRHADVLVLEQARRNLDVYLLFLPKFLRRSQWALWGHGRDYVESRSRFSEWLQLALTTRCDWFFAYTSGGARHVEHAGLRPERITTVMNSLDTAAIQQGLRNVSPDSVAEFKSRHGLRDKVASFVGALDESKRLPFLLAAIRALEVSDPDVSFVIAGDGPMRDEVALLAVDLPNVHVIGRVEYQEKYTLLSLTDVLLVPGRVGLVAVDALAAGIPIVTTDWEYHAPEYEYLQDGVNCRVSENNVDSYTAVVRQILSDNELQQKLSRNCLAQAEQLGVERMAQNFYQGILLLLSRKASA